MRVKVTADGIQIPPSLTEDWTEVEITREGRRLIVVPVRSEDPIWGLGENPVALDIADAADDHDRHLYG